jgi:cell division transport system permease protein
MNGSSFGYLLKQGVASVWLNRVMSIASIGILTACLIILGGVGLLAVNLRDTFMALENQNEVIFFLDDAATDTQVRNIKDKLEEMEAVTDIVYLSKADALESYKESMGDKGELLDLFQDDNPMPASYNVRLSSLEHLDEVVDSVGSMPGVWQVNAPTMLADMLAGIRSTLTVLGSIIIGILLIASIVVISNTIKLTVFSRRKEINIMRYVGATNRFIRMPFKVEGLTIGFISAIIAFIVIFFVYQSLETMLFKSDMTWVQWISSSIIPFDEVWYWVLGGFGAGGMLIGLFGSSSAMRKHLKV